MKHGLEFTMNIGKQQRNLEPLRIIKTDLDHMKNDGRASLETTASLSST
jgi:hypothetical protein